MLDDEWGDYAACKGMDPAIFYPDLLTRAAKVTAKAVCATCAVRSECLEWALRNQEGWGVWGGHTTEERKRMRARRDRRFLAQRVS